jgi:23S rRNA pseudouridine2605 synthase
MRINRYLAQCGLGSRRKCDEFIVKGLIKVNGKINKDFSYNVKIDDYIQFNNKLVEQENKLTIILNKPKGYICSKEDNINRKVIYDLLPFENLFSVGRLDYDTTGIILLTNDGNLCYRLSHPKFKIKKKYYVSTDLKLTKDDINKIEKGLFLDQNTKVRADISFLSNEKNVYYWKVILTEGKNREIKRIFNHFNIKVHKLHRYEFGGLVLGNVKEGKYKRINKNDLKLLESLI